MRAFISVEMNKEIKDYLYGLQLRLRKELKDSKINWVAKKNLHCTMKFLGEISKEQLEEVERRLEQIDFVPFEVHLGKIGAFPSEDYIRVIFAGLQPEKKVIALQQKIDMELLDLFSKEQAFHGHVTLARVKFVPDKKKMREILRQKIEPKIMSVEGFSIMMSRLKKEGPRYSVVWERKF